MQDKPTINLYLDARSPSKKHDNKYPVKVRITFQVFEGKKATWKHQYVLTKIYLSKAEFKAVESGKARGALKELQEKIYVIRAKVAQIIDENKRLTIEQFWDRYDNRKKVVTSDSKSTKLADLFQQIIDRNNDVGKIGTAQYYDNALKSLTHFGGADVSLEEIDVDWIKDYEIHMTVAGNLRTKAGASLNTASAYLRALRRVFRKAKKQGLVSHYPFGEENDGYSIRRKRTKKRPIPRQLLSALKSYVPETEAEAEAKDFVLFSYYANGMNFADMAYLKHTDIENNAFEFVRQKSKDTVREQKPIQVWLSPELRDILTRRSRPGTYVFGKIEESMTPKQIKDKIHQWRKTTKKWFRRISEKLGFGTDVDLQRLRHSFTSVLLQNGVPLTKVKDALGHAVITTTDAYAEELDLETSKLFSKIL